MGKRILLSSRKLQTLLSLTVVAAGSNWVCSAYAGVDLPKFRQGQWEVLRTANGQQMRFAQCVNPTDDMEAQKAAFQKSGCKYSPIQKQGQAYTYTSECAMKLPQGALFNSKTKSVLTVTSDSAYAVEVTGTINGKPSTERLTAVRKGDCAQQSSAEVPDSIHRSPKANPTK